MPNSDEPLSFLTQFLEEIEETQDDDGRSPTEEYSSKEDDE
jgi:hypothetical protein